MAPGDVRTSAFCRAFLQCRGSTQLAIEMSALNWLHAIGLGLRSARRPVAHSLSPPPMRSSGTEIWRFGPAAPSGRLHQAGNIAGRPPTHPRATPNAEYSTGRERDAPPPVPEFCSGCGVRLQDGDPDRAGFFQLPKNWGLEPVPKPDLLGDDIEFSEEDNEDEDGNEDLVDGEDGEIGEDDIARMNAEIEAAERRSGEAWVSANLSDFDIAVDEWLVSGMIQPPMFAILCMVAARYS